MSRSYLPLLTSAAPLLGADHAVDRIRRRTNLSIHSIYESGFVLIANFFFLVNRDLMVRGNGWSRFLAKVYLFLSFSFLIFIRATILVEGEIWITVSITVHADVERL